MSFKGFTNASQPMSSIIKSVIHDNFDLSYQVEAPEKDSFSHPSSPISQHSFTFFFFTQLVMISIIFGLIVIKGYTYTHTHK